MRRPYLVLLATLAGCTCSKTNDGSLAVKVTLRDGLLSTCVRLDVGPAADGTAESAPMVLSGQKELRVAVQHLPSLPDHVTVRARGYANTSCTTLTFPEEKAEVEADFVAGKAQEVLLVLGPTSLRDDDHDHYTDDVDCNDHDPLVHPGAVEACGNGADDDCNGATDCADPACQQASCGADGGAVCQNSRCEETQCANGADDDGNGKLDCADPTCDLKPCLNGGICRSLGCRASNEKGLCFDGIDNDGDGKLDCVDEDCSGYACTTHACETGASCINGLCDAGIPKSCTTPPDGGCYVSPGQCQLPGGQCSYSVRTGACNDGSLCTVNDTCKVDGTCSGNMVVCVSPPNGCYASPGTCLLSTGQCDYPVRLNAACDDGQHCTVSDQCTAGGACVGAPVTCPAAGECQSANGCDVDGGCLFAPRTGQACDAGLCTDAGTCVAPPLFPYVPSNFNEQQLPARGPAQSLNCASPVIDSTTPPYFSSWCGSNQPGAAVITQPDGTEALLLAMNGLTIANGTTLRVVGDRPVILAVVGNVSISGRIEAGARNTTQAGAGGNASCPDGGAGSSGRLASSVAGGGGGGARGESGAPGGDGWNAPSTAGGRGGDGGTPWVGFSPLHGGCPGGAGSDASGSAGGQPGLGGGAIQLSATGTMTLSNNSGAITSAGGGGAGGASGGATGGGGGGSGGLILLEATSISLSNQFTLSANGGGGGAGGQNGQKGNDGTDGHLFDGNPAAGGSSGAGGTGGTGGADIAAASAGGTPSGNTDTGGGGGGGGVGVIRLNVMSNCSVGGQVTITPPATSNKAGASGCP